MKLATIILVTVLALIVGFSDALVCYKCSGTGDVCPKDATEAQLSKITKEQCAGILSTVCSTYSIDLLNGQAYTFRGCEPTYVGGVPSKGNEFCTFVKSLYDPLVANGLLASSSCDTCDTTDCNT